jgi:hypothetical protein
LLGQEKQQQLTAVLDPAASERVASKPRESPSALYAARVRDALPDVLHKHLSSESKPRWFWVIGLSVMAMMGVVKGAQGSVDPAAAIGNLAVVLVVTIGFLLFLQHHNRRMREQSINEWNSAYKFADEELRCTSLPVLIADPNVWEFILSRTKGNLLALNAPERARGGEDMLEFAGCYYDALREYMRGTESVQATTVLAGHANLSAYRGNGNGRNSPSLELGARLRAICDYFISDLEQVPEQIGWRELMERRLEALPELSGAEPRHFDSRLRGWEVDQMGKGRYTGER